jgi:hypothetical protein
LCFALFSAFSAAVPPSWAPTGVAIWLSGIGTDEIASLYRDSQVVAAAQDGSSGLR